MTDVPVVLGINRINARVKPREWFRRLPPHALAIPPFLVTKRIEPELPT